jgi:hypothetical protein
MLEVTKSVTVTVTVTMDGRTSGNLQCALREVLSLIGKVQQHKDPTMRVLATRAVSTGVVDALLALKTALIDPDEAAEA